MHSKIQAAISKYYLKGPDRKGEIQMMCPFRENHPDGSGQKSFYLNLENNGYHCWSCEAHGSAISLLTIKFNVPMDVVIGGVINSNSFEEFSEYEDRHASSEKGLIVTPCVLDIPLSLKPPKSLVNKYGESVVKQFRVGFGEVNTRGLKGRTYPIYVDGTLVGVQYRATINGDRILWFTENFDKEHILYNHPKKLNKNPKRILVEGPTDVINIVRLISGNVSGIFGSYTTKGQLQELYNRGVRQLALAFDNDIAGKKCVERTYLNAKDMFDVTIIPYNAEDPGDLESAEDWLDEHEMPYEEYALREAMSEHGEEYIALQKECIKQHEKGEKNRR